MKTKIFLILIIIIFAVSCTKNNTANPVNVSGNNSSDTETKDTSSSDDSKNNNTGTSSDNGNSAENSDTKTHENDDKATVYKGAAKHTINTKGIITQPEDIEIYADIYEDENIVELYIPRRIFFENARKENGNYNLTKTEDGKTYILSMTVSGDSINNLDLTIQGQGETVYIKADKLNKTE